MNYKKEDNNNNNKFKGIKGLLFNRFVSIFSCFISI